MRLSVDEARALAARVLGALGHGDAEAAMVADHLLDCELRGVAYGGLARALSIAERLRRTGDRRRPITVLHETPVSARLDGGDQLGYLVARRATEIAIAKAAASGIALVGASDTWYTGMLSYYAEMAAAQGLVSFIASNASPWVAPHGATEGRFGTNPVCFGFPSAGEPVIWDIGTASIMLGELILRSRVGESIEPGLAIDASGKVVAYEFISKGFSRVHINTNEADPGDSLIGQSLGRKLTPGIGFGTPSESYAFPNKRLGWETVPPLLVNGSPLRTAHLRDPVGPEIHFGSEQFIDELAYAAGEDPVAFRLKYVTGARDRDIIQAAGIKAEF